MTKQKWFEHIDTLILRPSMGGNEEEYKTFLRSHIPDCPVCQARRKTKKRSFTEKIKRDRVRNICGTSYAAAKRDGSI